MKRDRSSRKARRAAQIVAIVATAAGWVVSPEVAHAKTKGAWSVLRTQDPITGRQTCAVSALDRIGGLRFTKVGILYAVVENNPDAGLLVGISSGGRWRLPVGDIVWRVDDKPYRTLRAMDNPEVARTGNPALMASQTSGTGASAGPSTNATATAGAATVAGGTGEAPSSGTPAFVETYSKTLAATMERQSAMVAALTATATMASGDNAKAMLEEMRAGKSLLFRQQAYRP